MKIKRILKHILIGSMLLTFMGLSGCTIEEYHGHPYEHNYGQPHYHGHEYGHDYHHGDGD